MNNEVNLCEIYSKLSDCPFHHKQIEFVCTSPKCTKPRLSCNKCLFDNTHNSCMSKMVLLEDVLAKDCFKQPKNSIRNWIPSEHQLHHLSNIQESIKIKNNDILLQETTCLIEEKWSQIENEVKMRLFEILEGLHLKILELFKRSSNDLKALKAFENHFNPEKLIEIFQLTPIEELNKALSNFFSMTPEELMQNKPGKQNSNVGEENFFLYIMAKFRENINFNFKQLNVQIEQELKKYELELSLQKQDLVNVSRFGQYCESMNYGNQRSDCITFTISQPVLFHGVAVYKSKNLNDNWNILLMILEGEKSSSPLLKKQLFRVKNTVENAQNPMNSLIFDSPVEISNDKKYTLYLLINGSPTFKGINGEQSILEKGVVIRFFETIYSEKEPKNITGVNTGQIPLIILSFK